MARYSIKKVGKTNRKMAICKERMELHVGALAICFALAFIIWFYMVGIGVAHGNRPDDKQAVTTDTSAGMNDISETEPTPETSGEMPAQTVVPT